MSNSSDTETIDCDDHNGMRKGIFAELFILYLIHLIISNVSYFQNPDQDSIPAQNNDGAPPPNQSQQKQSIVQISQWNKFFTIFFGYHIIPIGMVLLYQPKIVSIIFAYLHLLSFIGILVGHKFEKQKIVQGCYTLSGLFNLALIFASLAGLADHEQNCN